MKLKHQLVVYMLGMFFLTSFYACTPKLNVTEENAEDFDSKNINLHLSDKSFEEEFKTLLDYLKTKSKSSLCFNAPATDEQIHHLEKALGRKLPQDIVKIYKIANGQKEHVDCVNFFHEGAFFLSTDAAFQQWQLMNSIIEDDASFGDLHGKLGAVYDYGWTANWLPIGSFGNGDLICVDFNPTSIGKSGQIIDFFHEGGRTHLGFSIKDYISTLNTHVNSGKLAFDASCNCLSQVDSDIAWRPNQ